MTKSGSSRKKASSESALTKRVKKWLNKEGIFHYKASDRYKIGIPDILACVEGKFVAIELKAGKNTPSVHQELFIKQVKESGGYGAVCYTLKEVIAVVEEARNESAN